MSSDALAASLRAAVDATPDDIPLRVHLAELLAERGERADAVRHAVPCSQVAPLLPECIDLVEKRAKVAPTRHYDPHVAVTRLLWLVTGGLAYVSILFFTSLQQEVSGGVRVFCGVLCAAGSVFSFRTVRQRR